MTISSNNIMAHELTGLSIRIDASPDPTLEGISGVIRDETKNTIIVEAGERLLTVPKDKVIFSFELSRGDRVRIEGARIGFRPEDRVKRGMAKW